MSDKLISRILNALMCKELGIKVYSDRSIVFTLWETELPIAVDVDKHKVYFSTDLLMDEQILTTDMMYEITQVMGIIENSFKEIEEWVE